MNYRQYFKQQFAAITKKDIELQDGFSVTELHAIENIFSSRPVALQEYYHLIGKHPINNSSFPVFLNCSRESREVPEFIVPTLIEKNTNFFG